MENDSNNKDQCWWLWVLVARWRFLIIVPLVLGLIALGISFLLPKWYEAEAEIMPLYRSSSNLGAIANLAMGIMSMGGGGGDYVLPMMTTPSDLWAALATSNAIVDTLIEEFDLGGRYNIKLREELRKKVRKQIKTEVTGEGILIISFEDKSPQFAAGVTNAIVDHLDNINRNFRMSSAGATRQFIEERLAETEIALAEAESSFAVFQKEHGAISLEDQTRVAIENAAQIRAELLMSEVEFHILTSSRKAAHGDVEDVHRRIKALQKQLNDLKTGEGESEPFGLIEIPDLAVEYARLFRELTIQELLFEYLTQQYEQARIEEKQDTPILQVLSRAKVPEKKSRPKKLVITILTVAGALILSCVWVLGEAVLTRMREEQPVKYKQLVENLGGKIEEDENRAPPQDAG